MKFVNSRGRNVWAVNMMAAMEAISAPALGQETMRVLDLQHGALTGVSDDGKVASAMLLMLDCARAAVWTAADGLRYLDQPTTARCATTTAISGDGTIIGGSLPFASATMPQPAAFWRRTGLPYSLGDLPGGSLAASVEAISFDGSVIVGEGRTAAGIEGWVWTAASGMVSIGDLPGGLVQCVPFAVSGDGTIVAGRADDDRGDVAFRWTEAGGMVALGSIAPGEGSRALAISRDGSTIVGAVTTWGGSIMFPFMWTEERGMKQVPMPPGSSSGSCTAVNADGSVIAGVAAMVRPPRGAALYAFVWDRVRGARVLEDLVPAVNSATLGTFHPIEITGMSGDGTVLVGAGVYGEAPPVLFPNQYGFVVHMPPPCWADVDGSGGVDGGDVESFFSAWQDGLLEGDFDHSGGIDGSDVGAFFGAWEAGC